MSHSPHDTHGHGAPADIYPAGASYSHGHHGHVIVSKRILIGILGILLFFTLATVGAAQAEVWFAHTFNVVIPQWVNVAVALSIATIKSTFVVLYFMQIRYDNPLNGIIVVFTLFCLAFFLGFTMIDLGNRKILYDYKGTHIVAGGIGGNLGSRKTDPGTSIAMDARKQADAKIEQLKADGVPIDQWPKFLAKYYKAHHGGEAHGHGEKLGHFLSEKGDNTPDRARPRIGLTLPELKPATDAKDAGHEAAKPGR